MDVTFRTLPGHSDLGILFFWSLKITAGVRTTLSDYFIPEAFYDYICIQRGELTGVDLARRTERRLPRQAFKGLFTRPLRLNYSTPVVVFGARLSLAFAEHFWEPRVSANAFCEQAWVSPRSKDLAAFAAELACTVQAQRVRKCPYPLLNPALEESHWLGSYSARHKRRLYTSVFGLSRQAIDRLRGIQAFLEQVCDFDQQTPRILGHVNPEVFYDQPHLNRVFKKVTGLTPLEYFAIRSDLQDNLMAASYNALASQSAML